MRSEQRPKHFEFRAAAWYRTSPDAEWRTGASRFVSTTGAVIETTEDPPRASDGLVVVIGLSATGCLLGRGRVVRSRPSSGSDVPAEFVIAVDQFTIEHRDSILSESDSVLHRC